jgi:hypothetical protein
VSATLWIDYNATKDELFLAPRNHTADEERRKRLQELRRRIREALRQERAHEDTHDDEFH